MSKQKGAEGEFPQKRRLFNNVLKISLNVSNQFLL